MERSGFLAHSAGEFKNTGLFGPNWERTLVDKPSPYTITNSDLHIHLPLLNCWSSFLAVSVAGQASTDISEQVTIHIGGNATTGRLFRRQYPRLLYSSRLAVCSRRERSFLYHRDIPISALIIPHLRAQFPPNVTLRKLRKHQTATARIMSF